MKKYLPLARYCVLSNHETDDYQEEIKSAVRVCERLKSAVRVCERLKSAVRVCERSKRQYFKIYQ
jgi:hypothetical protein